MRAGMLQYFNNHLYSTNNIDTRTIYLIWNRKVKYIKPRHRKILGQVHFLEARCQLYKCDKP